MNLSYNSSSWAWKLNKPWHSQRLVQAIAAVTLSLVLATALFRKQVAVHSTTCDFPAVFNFGDSNSDTGGTSAAFHRLPYPYGYSFFHNPSGRYSDGRLITDFIAEKLGLPYLSAYLDSIGASFSYGVNFAAAGSTIQPVDARIWKGGFSPFSLDVQVSQFEQFKARVLELHYQGRSVYVKNNLPRPEDFSKALYTLDIGQNDLHAGFESMNEEQVMNSLPDIVNKFALAVENLYQLGGRTFWIHNTGPIGCLPYFVSIYPPKDENADENGCVKSQNLIAQEFNKQLKDSVSQLRSQHPDAVFTYTDVYAAKYSLISEAKRMGFSDPFGICCGHYGGDYRVSCGGKVTVNGTEFPGDLCTDPKLYISWDGIHYSQTANQIVADRILDGHLSDPPAPINLACLKSSQLRLSETNIISSGFQGLNIAENMDALCL